MRPSQPVLVVFLAFATLVVVAIMVVMFLPGEAELVEPTGPVVSQSQELGNGPQIAPAEASPPPAPRAAARPVEAPKVRLGPNTIVGKVIDVDTLEPIPAFRVDVLPHDPDAHPLERLQYNPGQPFKTTTGIFRLDHQEGLWDVVVRAPTYKATWISGYELPAEDNKPVEFGLQHGPGIAGKVWDWSGMSARDIDVHLHVVALADDVDRPQTLVTRTDREGRFRFSPLPAGSYEVSLIERRNTLDRAGGLNVGTGTVEVELTLRRRHQLLFKIDSLTGGPVGDARLELRAPGHVSTARSRPNGQAVLRHVPPGSFTLTVEREGFLDLQELVSLDASPGNHIQRLIMEPDPDR